LAALVAGQIGSPLKTIGALSQVRARAPVGALAQTAVEN
jgi:hypothetical protein